MKTTKEILSENRNSIISSIKYIYNVYRNSELMPIMKDFLNYCEENKETVLNASNAKNTKTLLKYMVQKMAISQRKEKEAAENMRIYGKTNPKLSDIMGRIAEREEDNGNVWHPIYKTWVKKENAFSSMSKNPQFA